MKKLPVNFNYDPFGMILSGRNWVSGSENYRFGFNGQEQDDEVYGIGNLNTAEFWEYDTRLGRRLNFDPLVCSDESPYVVFGNNPIFMVDPAGNKKSSHTDSEGNVIAVFDDGDNGIYKHKGNKDAAEKEVNANHSSENTSAGGEKMGESEYWDEFARINNKTGEIKKDATGKIKHVDSQIHYGQSIDGMISTLNNEVIQAFDGLKGKDYYNALQLLAKMSRNG